jgi:hypothetical protein
MTSFAFILRVVPLVLASGAGASARLSIGITVFTGMLASTCLAVLFVPPFFAVVQSFEEWRIARNLRAGAQAGRVADDRRRRAILLAIAEFINRLSVTIWTQAFI